MKPIVRCAVAALIAASSFAANATLMAINFTLAGASVSGSGTAFTDSSNLDPLDFTINPADLVGMTMSVTGIPGVPATSSFSKADLNSIEWVLSVDGGGGIIDLNFFMRGGLANADGYSIEGISPFTGVFCQGAAATNACAGGGQAVLDRFVIHVTDVQAAVPEPLSLALVGLGLAGLGLSRRKQS